MRNYMHTRARIESLSSASLFEAAARLTTNPIDRFEQSTGAHHVSDACVLKCVDFPLNIARR